VDILLIDRSFHDLYSMYVVVLSCSSEDKVTPVPSKEMIWMIFVSAFSLNPTIVESMARQRYLKYARNFPWSMASIEFWPVCLYGGLPIIILQL